MITTTTTTTKAVVIGLVGPMNTTICRRRGGRIRRNYCCHNYFGSIGHPPPPRLHPPRRIFSSWWCGGGGEKDRISSTTQGWWRNERTYFSSTFEPTLLPSGDSSGQLPSSSSSSSSRPPERPCTLVLAEDFGSLESTVHRTHASVSSSLRRPPKSWHDSFSNVFPQQYGIAYTQWSLPEEDHATFDVALTTMKRDFVTSGLQQPVMITRGPVMSWLVQFYLESLPLAGLVMVDPLPFNDPTACELYRRYYQKLGTDDDDPSPEQQQLYHICEDYVNHWDHWTMKLESGVIPMMVLSTVLTDSMLRQDHLSEQPAYDAMSQFYDDEHELHTNTTTSASTGNNNAPSEMELEDLYLWKQYAEQTATRHSSSSTTGPRGGGCGVVPVFDVDPYDIKQCSTIIRDWIEDKVL
jgi:hypothetical protein